MLTLLYNIFGLPRPNWLLRSAGLPVVDIQTLDAETTKTILGLLTEYAARQLQSGVVFSRKEWEVLGDFERAALAAAGNQERVLQAIRIGEASEGDIGRSKVRSEIDGGAELENAILHSFVSGLHDQKQKERRNHAR